MKVIIKKNYFWSKKIKTWEYLSNRKGLQRDLGVLIILRSRLKVCESDSRFSVWLTESILSSCNSSGPLYPGYFRSWKHCWRKNCNKPCSLTTMLFVFFLFANTVSITKMRWWKGEDPVGSGTILKQDQTLVTAAQSGNKADSQISIWFLFLDFNMTRCHRVISSYHFQCSFQHARRKLLSL